MKITSFLPILLIALFSGPASSTDIEVDINCTVGNVGGTFGEGQTLSGVATFFTSQPIVFGLGDTLTVNLLCDKTIEVYDFGEPTYEAFSFALNTTPGSPGFGGTWRSSLEALGASGDIWSGPITKYWTGGGAGFGWGGSGIQVTASQGRFTGIKWTTTLTSANEGVPMTLTAFTGIQMHADGILVLPTPLPIDIDIKPGDEPNSINPRSRQKIPVAVLTTNDFDALQVDPLSTAFGPGGATEVHERGHVADVDSDGDLDLLLHFDVQDTGLVCGDTEATLTADTYSGEAVEGTDSVNIVGCTE